MACRRRWALTSAVMLASSAPSWGADVSGTYRLAGTADVATPALNRRVDVHADAHLRPGGVPRAVVVTISAEGGSCDVAARLDDRGALQFSPDQRCSVDLKSSDTRGHLDGVLRAGHGRVVGERLELELELDVDGAVSVRSASRVEVLGHAVDVPSAWTPEIPVHGRAHATAAGMRDHSRAAGR